MTWEDAVRSMIDDPSRQDVVIASYFDAPLHQAAIRYSASSEWTEINRLLGRPRGIAVDIGAGNGIVSYALAKSGWQVVAVEPDPSALVGAAAIRQLAQDSGVTIDVRAGVGERLPLEDGEAAVIVVRQVLHHASDLSAFCREIARVLAPGGLLITARDHVISGPEQLQTFLDGHPLHALYGGENAFTLAQYRFALMQAGLRIEKQLNSLASAINYSPHTYETLRSEIAKRLGLLGSLSLLLKPAPIMAAGLRLLSIADRRPGRLVSFVCAKPN
jgi:SAM-dependent methyltransferase